MGAHSKAVPSADTAIEPAPLPLGMDLKGVQVLAPSREVAPHCCLSAQPTRATISGLLQATSILLAEPQSGLSNIPSLEGAPRSSCRNPQRSPIALSS